MDEWISEYMFVDFVVVVVVVVVGVFHKTLLKYSLKVKGKAPYFSLSVQRLEYLTTSDSKELKYMSFQIEFRRFPDK